MPSSNPLNKQELLDALLPLSALYSEKGLNPEQMAIAVCEFQNLFLEYWINSVSHSDFYDILRITLQKVKRAKRHLGPLSNREDLLYSLGFLSGLEHIFQELYTAEERERMIVAACSECKHASQIMQTLYTANEWHGICHSDLAESVGLSDEELTEEMKFLLNCRGVSATGRGESVHYTLTPAGKRYIYLQTERTNLSSGDPKEGDKLR